jgi:hypothetical protein
MTSLMGDKKREYHCEYNNKGSITLLPFFLLFVCIRLRRRRRPASVTAM